MPRSSPRFIFTHPHVPLQRLPLTPALRRSSPRPPRTIYRTSPTAIAMPCPTFRLRPCAHRSLLRLPDPLRLRLRRSGDQRHLTLKCRRESVPVPTFTGAWLRATHPLQISLSPQLNRSFPRTRPSQMLRCITAAAQSACRSPLTRSPPSSTSTRS